jgi:hypothetical protein
MWSSAAQLLNLEGLMFTYSQATPAAFQVFLGSLGASDSTILLLAIVTVPPKISVFT